MVHFKGYQRKPGKLGEERKKMKRILESSGNIPLPSKFVTPILGLNFLCFSFFRDQQFLIYNVEIPQRFLTVLVTNRI